MFIRYIKFTLLGCFLLLAIAGKAQITPDTTLNNPIPPEALAKADTVKMSDTIPPAKPLPFEPIPKRAGLYSAIIPGTGQIYNRQYWKAPIIYAGMAVTGYFLKDNIEQYRTYRKAYIGRIDNDPSTTDNLSYRNDELRLLQDTYKRYTDLTILFTALGYMIQIMDAVASAHLKNFDVSPDISMQMRPVMHQNGIGFGLVMHLK